MNHYDPNQPRNAEGEWTDAGIAIKRAASDIKESSVEDIYKREKEKLGITQDIKMEIKPEVLKGWAVAGVTFTDKPDSEGRYFFKSEIQLKKRSIVDNEKFIAHEMKHIQQSELKKLYFKGGYFYWEGEKHTSLGTYKKIQKGMMQNQDKELYDKSFKKYRALPWEKEADDYAGT